jgi:hypothetical protein
VTPTTLEAATHLALCEATATGVARRPSTPGGFSPVTI